MLQLRELSDPVFRGLRDLIHAEAGISLGPQKKALVQGRLAKRVRQLGMLGFRDYLDRVRVDLAERQRMVEHICTHETAFFREPQQFEYLEQQVFPAWRAAAALGTRSRRVRAWSAGCATGEEPYSLAMTLLESFGVGGFELEVIATDLSHRVLESAEQGIFAMKQLPEIPERFHKRYLRRGVGENEGRFAVGSALRALVRFRHLNLRGADWTTSEPLDLVLCRNVLIYFEREDREAIGRRLAASVAPGGLLLVGHSENLNAADHHLRLVAPTIYRRPA